MLPVNGRGRYKQRVYITLVLRPSEKKVAMNVCSVQLTFLLQTHRVSQRSCLLTYKLVHSQFASFKTFMEKQLLVLVYILY